MSIAVCIVGYNRPASMERLLRSVGAAYYPQGEEVALVVSVDHSGSDEVADLADGFVWEHGPKRVIRHPRNLGLRRHILGCGELLDEFDALIVLEDDLVVAPDFYLFARECVGRYADSDEVAGISLYSFSRNYLDNMPFEPLDTGSDIYLMQCAMSWGQVWMRRQWREFVEWYTPRAQEFPYTPALPDYVLGWPSSSWLRYHTRYLVETGRWFVHPYVSRSTCFADAGVHSRHGSTLFQTPLQRGAVRGGLRLEPGVRYDVFFECELLYGALGYSRDELTLDIYGNNDNRRGTRYLLTRRNLPYEVVRSFGIQLRPVELNVLMATEGNELFLYDTSRPAACPLTRAGYAANRRLWQVYMYGLPVGVRSAVRRSLSDVKRRLTGRKGAPRR